MLTVSQIVNADGSITRHASVSVEQAYTTLRINLGVETGGRDLGLPLYRIFRNGITANLIFDHAATRRLQEKALRDMKPINVDVSRGQTLIEPGANTCWRTATSL